jgi:hypothetical protein
MDYTGGGASNAEGHKNDPFACKKFSFRVFVGNQGIWRRLSQRVDCILAARGMVTKPLLAERE